MDIEENQQSEVVMTQSKSGDSITIAVDPVSVTFPAEYAEEAAKIALEATKQIDKELKKMGKKIKNLFK